MTKLLEITATYQRQRQRFENASGDVIIGDAMLRSDVNGKDGPIVVKGVADEDDPAPHQTYRFYGHWTEYDNRRTGQTEKQFHFKTFVRSAPHSRAGIIGYLEKAPAIGKVFAARLFDKFGADAVRVLREDPDVAAAACDRLTVEGAISAAAWLEEQSQLEDCTIDLIELLDGRGFRKSVAKEAVKIWGNRASQVIRKNPYLLMARIRGCGFKLTDALYLDLGGRVAALKRQALCAWYAIASNTSGDTWHYSGVAEQGLKGSIGGADVRFADAMRVATRGRMLSRAWTDGKDGELAWDGNCQWVAEERKSRNERRAAELVARKMGDGEQWPEAARLYADGLSSHQGSVSCLMLRSPICILGGSPGTGKTYTAASIIRAIIKKYGVDSVAVCAPTGKAAVRISEAMNASGVPLRARTIHSLLKVVESSGRAGWTFGHNATNPLPFRFLFVDESSMIDTDLMASFLSAVPRGSFVLFIGDINQLAPVGHGAPLRDMIAAGVPYGELFEIKRNDGGIVQACADIRDGKAFKCEGNLHNAFGNTPQEQIDRTLDIIRDVSIEQDLDRVWDFQVLVAVNKKSPLSRKEINKTLQAQLNPNPIVSGTPFRLADKVINTKNGFYPAVDKNKPPGEDVVANNKGDLYVANGEIGRVTRVEVKYMEVKLSSPDRFVRVPRGSDASEDGSDDDATGTGCNWDLAYAISTHKSQGSEFPVVIILIDEYPGARTVCDRSWIYTAISRAKTACYLVGKKATADRFCRANNIAKRKTFMRESILFFVNKYRSEGYDDAEVDGEGGQEVGDDASEGRGQAEATACG